MNKITKVSKIQDIGSIIENNKVKLTKMFDLLDLIDYIDINEDTVNIKLSKNLVLENEGHTVMVNKGMSVNISKEIHLNPEIKFNKDEIDSLEQDLEDAVIKTKKEILNKV